MRVDETLESVSWTAMPPGGVRRLVGALVATVLMLAVVGWAAWRPRPPEPEPLDLPSPDHIAAAVVLAELRGQPWAPSQLLLDQVLERARASGDVEAWRRYAAEVLPRQPDAPRLARSLAKCVAYADPVGCAAERLPPLETMALLREQPSRRPEARVWLHVLQQATAIEEAAVSQRARALEGVQRAWAAETAASDAWHGPPWLRGAYASAALLLWLVALIVLGWRSRRVEVELRAGTLRIDDLVLPLDQVAGVREERGCLLLQLHTGDELATRCLGPEARAIAERIPVSAAPAPLEERRAVEQILRSAR